MKTNDFDRWAELVDREAIGEPITTAEKVFCRRLEEQNLKCQAELAFWEEVETIETESDDASRALVDRVLAAVEKEPEEDVPVIARKLLRRKRLADFKWLFAAAAVALIGVGVGTKSNIFGLVEQRGHRALEAVSSRVELVYISGQVLVNGKSASVGQRLLVEGNELEVVCGSACIAIDPGIDVCLGERGRVKLSKIVSSEKQLDLYAGRLTAVLKTQPKGGSFSVGANGTVVTAVGTAFSVEVTPERGEVETIILSGKVALGANGVSRSLVAHQQAVIRGGKQVVSSVVRSKESRHWALVQPTELWQQPSTAILDLPKAPADARVVLDGQPIGIAPLATLIPSGGHILEVQVKGRTVIEKAFTAEAGQPTTVDLGIVTATPACQNYLEDGASEPQKSSGKASGSSAMPLSGDTPTASKLERSGEARPSEARPRPSSPHVALAPSLDARAIEGRRTKTRNPATVTGSGAPDLLPEGISAREMLQQARTLMAERRWNEAAEAYRDLTAAHPGSSEAKVGLVSLGQLELNHIGQPEMALMRFNHYLNLGERGVLDQEARYARISALKALGRIASEANAIEEFLKLYPDSFESKLLRERLRAINATIP
jgi:hypothetical protein